MSKNKILVILSVFGTLIALALFNSRDVGLCNFYCGSAINKYQDLFLFFPLLLLLSVITLFTKSTVFTYWWKFARFAIPFVLLSSLVISLELHHSPGGWFNIDNEIDQFLTLVIYLFFILGSIWQMYRGYQIKD